MSRPFKKLSFFVFVAFSFVVFCSHFVRALDIGTAVTATPSAILLTQADFRWYANADNLTPSVPLAALNAPTTTPSVNTVMRLRLNVRDASLVQPAGATFRLQFSNSTSSGWADIGTSTAWVFFDNPGVADGQIIASPILPSDVGESYGESNPSAASPNQILPTQTGEWDWAIQNANATTGSAWYFRLATAFGGPLDGYENYPTLSGVAPSAPATPTLPPGTIIGGGGVPIIVPPATPTSSINPPPIKVQIPGQDELPTPCDSIYVQRVDFSHDCRVDMIDLSIMVYYYDQVGLDITPYDLNSDEAIDLYDVSILMYYWTG